MAMCIQNLGLSSLLFFILSYWVIRAVKMTQLNYCKSEIKNYHNQGNQWRHQSRWLTWVLEDGENSMKWKQHLDLHCPVATSHMWKFKLESNTIKKLTLQLHQSHVQELTITCCFWLLHSSAQNCRTFPFSQKVLLESVVLDRRDKDDS